MSPAWPSEKPRRRTSSSPVSPAWKVTPAVARSTSRKSSSLRSWISFSVITVTLCGMSISFCSPLPISVLVARSRALLVVEPSPSALSRTVTVPRVPAVPAGADAALAGVGAGAGSAVCARAAEPSDPASSIAPRGSSGAWLASITGAAGACRERTLGLIGLNFWAGRMVGSAGGLKGEGWLTGCTRAPGRTLAAAGWLAMKGKA